MIPQKVKDHIEEYISQEVYVQIAIIKGKEKVSTETAIDKYFNTNHFRDFSEGKPYFHFIDGLRDKCLGKLKNSPMRDKACLLYTSPSPRDGLLSRMPSSA